MINDQVTRRRDTKEQYVFSYRHKIRIAAAIRILQ